MTPTVDEVIQRFNPQRDTGGCVFSCMWDIMHVFGNLANTFYVYLMTTHPITILLVYVLLLSQSGLFLLKFDTICKGQISGHLPIITNVQHYGKGRWKYHLKGHRPTPPNYQQRYTRSSQVYKKYKYRRPKPKATQGWDSLHTWTSLLDKDYSLIFDHNCNTYPSYLDTVTNGLDMFLPEFEDHQTSGYTAIEEDLYNPKG